MTVPQCYTDCLFINGDDSPYKVCLTVRITEASHIGEAQGVRASRPHTPLNRVGTAIRQ